METITFIYRKVAECKPLGRMLSAFDQEIVGFQYYRKVSVKVETYVSSDEEIYLAKSKRWQCKKLVPPQKDGYLDLLLSLPVISVIKQH